ncbi:disease resistance protein Roq1 [Solanum lycopersicum]|uniref:disease resistance protein Roq1 n=1 Tax=Solanum lycopersicum TaxID=4081 RepID=UPI0037491945
MSHASSSKVCKYDIFLSFRGEDTRRTFVSHLYNALEQRGFHAFKDDERLEAGQSISAELLKAIEDARFAVVVFSKSYASSRWCLEELAHIIKCKMELEQVVIPVFYDVSPSDVRHQNSPFADSFFQHEVKYKDDMEKVQRWRGEFAEAGKISGYHLLNFNGMGGIGKSELARVLYERYRHLFEADCFLGDVGELHHKNGLAWLAQVVIRKLLGEKMSVTSEHEGVIILKNRLRWKKVLFILDDVNHREQLEFLVGGTEWFGMGSRIILTSRDKHLLISHVGDNVYEVQLLSEDEALELFSRHAFREKSPKEDFMELSREVVKHAGGLSLALKVLGSSFYRRDKKHWRHIIDRLKRIPHKDILGKLKLSFDVLDKDEKELFLDIVFLVNVWSSGYDYFFYHILRYMSRGFLLIIDHLVEKSLLSIGMSNKIVMHNMMREMGENVLREEYTNSRIWLPEEVCDLFKGKLITEKVESLCIPKYYYFEDDFVNYSNIFKRMQSLKVLIVSDGTFSLNCAITYLPSSLRFIAWEGYPSISLPESFEPWQLVMLVLSKSLLVELCPISKKFSNLKHLDLRQSLELRKTPNFGDMPNLVKLNLEGCVNLEEVHPSLGHCRMLTYLSFSYCYKLKKLPKFVCMDSLETLNLIKCTSLQEFPEICGDMQCLSKLFLESPWIRSLSPSLSGLRDLQLTGCEVLESIPDTIRNVRYLRISGCNKLSTLPNSLFESQLLEHLRLYRCSGLVKLPISFGVQKNLYVLEIESCENLQKFPSFIRMESVRRLMISNSPKLDTFPEIKGDMHCLEVLTLTSTVIREVPSSIGNLSSLTSLNLSGCEDLVSLPNNLCNLMNLDNLNLRGCKRLKKLPENTHDLQELYIHDASKTAISQPHDRNILGGQLGSLRELDVSGRNISCLPKSFKGLFPLQKLNVQFCENLNELPSGELPPNLKSLFADYHLALKSIKDLVIHYLKLCTLGVSNCGTVSSEQVNVFLQHFLKTCIQCDFHQRDYFLFFFPRVRISELFNYNRCIYQQEMSIDLDPSWYTDKFIGFWICYSPIKFHTEIRVTLVCKSDPERKYSLRYKNFLSEDLESDDPFICCLYIPFETLWNNGQGNKEGKNPNDYYMLELSGEEECCWGIRLVYEEEAMSDDTVQRKNIR